MRSPADVGRRRSERRAEIEREELRPQGRKDETIEPGWIAEPHLHLRRMDIDVDEVGGDLEAEEDDRLPACEEDAAVAFLDGMEDRTVAERAARHEQVLELRPCHVVLGATDEPLDRDQVVGGFDLDEPGREGGTEKVADPRPPPVGPRQVVHPAAIVIERHRHGLMGQRRAHEGLRCVRPLRRRCAEERAAGRHLREQLVDLDGGADGASFRRHLPHHAGIDLEAGAVGGLRGA
jgi:hypothetical protein